MCYFSVAASSAIISLVFFPLNQQHYLLSARNPHPRLFSESYRAARQYGSTKEMRISRATYTFFMTFFIFLPLADSKKRCSHFLSSSARENDSQRLSLTADIALEPRRRIEAERRSGAVLSHQAATAPFPLRLLSSSSTLLCEEPTLPGSPPHTRQLEGPHLPVSPYASHLSLLSWEKVTEKSYHGSSLWYISKKFLFNSQN